MPIADLNKPIVAAFDFDGTITTRDSLLPFLLYTTGWWSTLVKLIILSPIFLGYSLGLISRQKTKERVLKKFFSGMPRSWLLILGELFAQSSNLDNLIPSHSQARIKWHQEQGHRCIIVSASIDSYLQPWGQINGFQDIISSRLKVSQEGLITGNLDGLNCWGPEKLRRLNELLGPRENYILYAYGDSRGDQELLTAADHAFYRQMPAESIIKTSLSHEEI